MAVPVLVAATLLAEPAMLAAEVVDPESRLLARSPAMRHSAGVHLTEAATATEDVEFLPEAMSTPLPPAPPLRSATTVVSIGDDSEESPASVSPMEKLRPSRKRSAVDVLAPEGAPPKSRGYSLVSPGHFNRAATASHSRLQRQRVGNLRVAAMPALSAANSSSASQKSASQNVKTFRRQDAASQRPKPKFTMRAAKKK